MTEPQDNNPMSTWIPPRDSIHAETRYGELSAKYPDGTVVRMKRTVIIETKWRMTVIGWSNLGSITFGRWEYETIHSEKPAVASRRPWWKRIFR